MKSTAKKVEVSIDAEFFNRISAEITGLRLSHSTEQALNEILNMYFPLWIQVKKAGALQYKLQVAAILAGSRKIGK